jgi:hypothetical protein
MVILWLSSFRVAYISLIPKAGDSSKPENYRPVIVASVVERLFHRVLVHRLTVMPVFLRQRAFRSGDRLYSNTLLLRSLVRDRQRQNKSTYLAFIDASKAFDFVSRQTMLLAVYHPGVPDILSHYIGNLYIGESTCLKINGQLRPVINPGQGVH